MRLTGLMIWAAGVLLLQTACVSQPHRTAETAVGSDTGGTVLQKDAVKIREALVNWLPRIQERFQIKGLSLTLVRNQKILWAEGFGYADEARGVLATADTVYRAGSLAKPMTALAVMQLEEADRLDIDQPLAAYLPAFSIRSRFDASANPITVRHILSHHSGLPTDLNKGMWTRTPFTRVAAQLHDEYTAFPPNHVYSYSNVGYSLLGHMVEAISQTPYAAYMDHHLFLPLGMEQTNIGASAALSPYLARGYRKGKVSEPLPIRDLPAYGLYTSANDLGRFMQMLFAGGRMDGARILPRETLEEMLEPQNTDVPLDLNIINGLGWFIESDSITGGGRVIRHGGTTLLYSSELIMLPEKGLGVAVLANSSDSRAVVSHVAEEILRLALRNHRHFKTADLRVSTLEREVYDPVHTTLGGNYATDLGLISIRFMESKLCACIIEKTFDLVPYPNGWFGIGDSAVDSLPPSHKILWNMRLQSRVIDGREVVIVEKKHKQVVLGEKIPETPVTQRWLQRAGEYELLNTDAKFPVTGTSLLVQDGQIFFSYKMPLLSASTIIVPLRPVSDTEAVIFGLGRTRGDTVQFVSTGGEERLRYSGFEGRKRAAPTRL